eukprot:5009755-Amphidinium_carterae.1
MTEPYNEGIVWLVPVPTTGLSETTGAERAERDDEAGYDPVHCFAHHRQCHQGSRYHVSTTG